jgi:hypothetical protein
MGWNGTSIKTSWLRQQGRGNASSRTLDWRFKRFFCDGCQREHGRYVDRTRTIDGKLLCNRQFYKHLDSLT